MSTMTGIDLTEYPAVRMKPEDLIPCVNPRKVLNFRTLLPAVEEERGQIIEPIIAWRPSANDPIRQRVVLEPHQAIPLRGHRRRACVLEIRQNPDKYPHDVWENAGTVPVIVIPDITEDKARNLTLDDQDKEPLMLFEVVLEVFRRFENDHSYQKVALDMCHGLYRGLLQKGEAKYREMLQIANGKDRIKKVQTDLRNPLDQWLYSAHMLGPAVKEQVIFYIKDDRDPIDLVDDEVRVFDAKLQNLSKLRSLWTNSKDADWSPIDKLEFDDTGVPHITGGNKVVNAEMEHMMNVFRRPEDFKDDKPKLPKATERDSVKSSARSKVGKLFSGFYCGEEVEGRGAADIAAFYMEERAKAIKEVAPDLHSSVRKVAEACLNETDMGVLKSCWLDLSTELSSALTEQTAKKGNVPAKKGK